MYLFLIFFTFFPLPIIGTQDSKRLYDDLMFNYNLHRRPGESPNQQTTVYIRLSLSQLIELDEINQLMMCSVWLRQTWIDLRLAWNSSDYGGVEVLHVPHEIIWVPDIVLFNAESAYNISISTKATIYSNGRVIWEPPAIFRSTCQINVRWFPFDEQECKVKFGSWSYPENLISLELIDNSGIVNTSQGSLVKSRNGIDISDYYPSVEWDIMSLTALRSSKSYRGCCDKDNSFVDLTFEFGLRRKTFFYTVNLLVPCISLAFLTLLVFYLPSDSGEKIQLSISILISLTFFFLLLTEMLPASGTAMPLIAKYLLFVMLMVSASVCVAVLVLNLHFRKQTTHKMGRFSRYLLLHWLPGLLKMRPHRSHLIGEPKSEKDDDEEEKSEPKVRVQLHRAAVASTGKRRPSENTLTRIGLSRELCRNLASAPADERLRKLYYSPLVIKAIENIDFIAQILKKENLDSETEKEWEYVANVIDRLFLWIFSSICIIGTIWIFGQAPIFYDNRLPYMSTNSSNQVIETLEELVEKIDSSNKL